MSDCAKLPQYKVFTERSVDDYVHIFTAWSAGDGMYARTGMSICGDGQSSALLDSLFDTVKAQGGIYHLYLHPWVHDWSDGSPIRRHIDHLQGRRDIWYVGYGHLYLYHFVQERGKVTVTALDAPGAAGGP